MQTYISHGEEMEEALYTEEDVIKTLSLMKVVEYEEDFEIEPGIRLKFTDLRSYFGQCCHPPYDYRRWQTNTDYLFWRCWPLW